MRLSVQEQKLVSIYHCGTRTATVSQLREAIPYMDKHDAAAGHTLIEKLEQMSESAFVMLSPEGVMI